MLKRILAIILCLALVLSGCGGKNENANTISLDEESDVISPIEEAEIEQVSSAWLESYCDEEYAIEHFSSLNDEELLTYVEDVVYAETVASLDSKEYFLENVSAVFISQEYLDEITFNSQSNIFFGYTLEELDEVFQDTQYVFTLGADGQTTVQELVEIKDETFENVLKDVAVGTGVILLCVTVSAVSGGLGAPAVAMIFSFSAKAGATAAISSAVFGGVSAGVVRGVETGDMDEALKAAALAGGEGFKWGAISGAVTGGVAEASGLYGISRTSGLTMNQVATIQQESKYPAALIKQFHSMDEYQVYKDAGLTTRMVNGKTALVRNIDINYVSDLAGKPVTNLERMKQGYAPIDPLTGKAYQLHHIGQKSDATLAILTEAEHQGNASILNIVGKESEIERSAFNKIRKEFWKDFTNSFS